MAPSGRLCLPHCVKRNSGEHQQETKHCGQRIALDNIDQKRQADRQVNCRCDRIAPAAIRTWNLRLLETETVDGGHRQAAKKDRGEGQASLSPPQPGVAD